MNKRLVILVVAAFSALPAAAGPSGSVNLANLLTSADTNEDGSITRQEFIAERASLFPKVDKDSSGGLSESEFIAVLNERLRSFASVAFRKVDTDGNGVISQDEWNNSPTRAFDKADKNGDGILSADELAARGK